MGTFAVSRDVDAPAAQVWAALVDWPRHGTWVPLTRVRVTTATAEGVGAGFVGRSGLGRLGFDDPMTVTAWQPPSGDRPGRCDITKTGRVVLGVASFTVTATGAATCRVRWSETIEIAGLRRVPLAGRVNDLVGRIAFAGVLRRMATEVEATHRGTS